MKIKDENAYKKSLIFSVCYVGFATIALFSMYPGSLLHGDWTLMSLLVTFPVSILSFGLIYSGVKNSQLVILVVQIVVFLLTWHLSYRFLKKEN